MADAPVVHIGENSPEKVALRLLEMIADVEKRALYGSGNNPVDREWIIRTYHQCIATVRMKGTPQTLVNLVPETE